MNTGDMTHQAQLIFGLDVADFALRLALGKNGLELLPEMCPGHVAPEAGLGRRHGVAELADELFFVWQGIAILGSLFLDLQDLLQLLFLLESNRA